MSLIGSIEQFKPGRDDFESYVERMKQFFICNVVEEDKKVSLFITLMGSETYSLLKNILYPETPESKSYDELVHALKKHLAPKRLVIAERFRFYKAQQMPGQSISDFIVQIKKLSHTCNFGSFLQDALRDKLVCGIESESIQRRLLSVDNLTFEVACNTALSVELAEQQSKLFSVSQGINVKEVIVYQIKDNPWGREYAIVSTKRTGGSVADVGNVMMKESVPQEIGDVSSATR